MELLVDGLIQVGQPFCICHLLTVVLDEGGQYLAVGGFVPLCAVVRELMILLARLLLRTHYAHAPVQSPSTQAQLFLCKEGLREQRADAGQALTLLVELSHLVEVHLLDSCILGGVLPLAYASLEVALLLDESNAVDTLVHTQRVLPVVAGLRIF